MAGEHFVTSVTRMVADGLRELRRAPDRCGGGCGHGCRNSQEPQPLDMGTGTPNRPEASVLEQLPDLEARRESGSTTVVGRWANRQTSRTAIRSFRTVHSRYVRSGQLHAKHRERRVGQLVRRSLQRSVGRLLSRTHLQVAVLGCGCTAGGAASSDTGAAIEAETKDAHKQMGGLVGHPLVLPEA